MTDLSHIDEHLDAIRDRNRAQAQAALLRDIATRQAFLADDPGRTARDVVHAIQSEAAHLEQHANTIDEALRGKK